MEGYRNGKSRGHVHSLLHLAANIHLNSWLHLLTHRKLQTPEAVHIVLDLWDLILELPHLTYV